MVWSVRQVKKSQLIGLVQFNGIGVEYRDVIGDCERGDHLNRWGGVGFDAVGIGPKLVIVKDNNKMVRSARQ